MYHCHLTGTMPRIQKLLIYDVFCLMSTYNLTHFNIFNILPQGPCQTFLLVRPGELYAWCCENYGVGEGKGGSRAIQ